MRFIIALIVSAALVFLCAKPLKKHPVPFYLGALALVGLYLYGTTINSSAGLWPYFMPLMQRCALAFLLFTVVMFVGVLRENSPLRSRLMPVRRQLSILGCIFAAGHIAFYTASYLPRITAGFTGNLTIALLLAALLVIMMAILMVTSFQIVKHRMTAAAWKRIQLFAYPFYLLTYVHLAMLLAPSALAGNETAVISLTVYSLITFLYVILRTKKALCRKTTHANATPAAMH
ncbi:ferric reductase-like transmembrane domain-containing protein [Paraeggerthella hongkongensis]|uniref:Uncharacterized protein n=1 Tax=Paraeggerthella hongkongensis TaxID=230658 RepID=A0A3N0BLF8_9ACTN|nr:ferric reductase-like transmembrane domain-containing protein [Paraeggerthella hongkongensis]RNL48913.1 hypothetical protein DMP08_00155 [Paraeggerthella hongkongensis]